MSEGVDAPTESVDDHPPATVHATRTLLLSLASAVLFGIGLLVTESVGEFAVDVDLKPFFIPYLIIAATRFGITTLGIAVGAAVGEGILDIFEGYELDDPIGFLGYVLGFTTFGWYLDAIADDPASRRALAIGATLGALVQAVFEGVAFLVFEATAGPLDATVSIAGNTLTHGILLGAIPLVAIHQRYGDRLHARLR
jgi:hypothetical protein